MAMTTRPIGANNSTINTTRTGAASNLTEAKKADRVEIGGQPADSVQPPPGGWDLSLSPQAREKAESFKKALDIARTTPDVREDRVADIKKRIKDGTYKVDSGKVADGMLLEAIRDKVAEDN
jgi:flagellar biosynthesis anti-sigma factor FlgM